MAIDKNQYLRHIIDMKNLVMAYRLNPELAQENPEQFKDCMTNCTYLLLDLQKIEEGK